MTLRQVEKIGATMIIKIQHKCSHFEDHIVPTDADRPWLETILCSDCYHASKLTPEGIRSETGLSFPETREEGSINDQARSKRDWEAKEQSRIEIK